MTVVTRGCPDAELLTSFVDDELDVKAHSEVLAHLDACPACAATVAADRRLKSAVRGAADPDLVPSGDLMSLLFAVPKQEGAEADDTVVTPMRPSKRRGVPSYFAAAASVVVLMVGAFAFVGALEQNEPAQNQPTTAIVPATDRFSQEHAATVVQAGFGGPGVAMVPVAAVNPAPASGTP